MADAKPVRKKAPAPKGGGKKSCKVEGCKRAYQAKGYCFFHYGKWKKGELPHGRYKSCSKDDCRKKVFQGGLCQEHFDAWKASRKGAKAAG